MKRLGWAVVVLSGCLTSSAWDDYCRADPACSDAGASDAGTSDAGTSDAGTSDAGTSDAGSSDAGSSDAGASDAGIDGGSAVVLVAARELWTDANQLRARGLWVRPDGGLVLATTLRLQVLGDAGAEPSWSFTGLSSVDWSEARICAVGRTSASSTSLQLYDWAPGATLPAGSPLDSGTTAGGLWGDECAAVNPLSATLQVPDGGTVELRCPRFVERASFGEGSLLALQTDCDDAGSVQVSASGRETGVWALDAGFDSYVLDAPAHALSRMPIGRLALEVLSLEAAGATRPLQAFFWPGLSAAPQSPLLRRFSGRVGLVFSVGADGYRLAWAADAGTGVLDPDSMYVVADVTAPAPVRKLDVTPGYQAEEALVLEDRLLVAAHCLSVLDGGCPLGKLSIFEVTRDGW
jgi:hypothetical protein